MLKSMSKCGGGWDFLTGLPGIQGRRWNPITGCPNLEAGKPCSTSDGVPYCYYEAMCKRYPSVMKREYQFHPDRLAEPAATKDPSLVAVGTAGDMWGWCGVESAEKVFDALDMMRQQMKEVPIHYYLFLTRFPYQYPAIEIRRTGFLDNRNIGLGVTVTCHADLWRIDELRKVPASMRWIIIEPCFFTAEEANKLDFTGIDWVILGTVTGIKDAKRYWPKWDTIDKIIFQARISESAIFFKQNLKKAILNDSDCDNMTKGMVGFLWLQEYPPQILEWAKKIRGS